MGLNNDIDYISVATFSFFFVDFPYVDILFSIAFIFGEIADNIKQK